MVKQMLSKTLRSHKEREASGPTLSKRMPRRRSNVDDLQAGTVLDGYFYIDCLPLLLSLFKSGILTSIHIEEINK